MLGREEHNYMTIRYKAIIKERLSEAYLNAKNCGCKEVEEIIKYLLIFLDL